MIDLYCERLGPGLWAEPLNALTNLAYIVAAWAAWRLIHRVGTRSRTLMIMVALLASIGIGSGLFHTFATPWALVLDVTPILVFQLSFFWFYFRRVMAHGPVFTALGLGCVITGALWGRQFRDILNGSLMYAPAFALLFCLGIYHYRRQRRERYTLLIASGAFLSALTFRTIDMAVCTQFPTGTHFLWHLLTAVVAYLGLKSLVLNWPAGTSPSGQAA